jgi:hypothetical protein
MIEPITFTISVTATAIASPFLLLKGYRILTHRREDRANAIIDGYHQDFDTGLDVEEYLYNERYGYRRVTVKDDNDMLEQDEYGYPLNEEVTVEEEEQIVDEEYEFDDEGVALPVCPYYEDHDYYIYCPVCNKHIVRVTTVQYNMSYPSMQDIIERNQEIMEKDIAFRTKHINCLYSSPKLGYLLTDVIKAKYIVLDDTKANRIILRDHLVQWYEHRVNKEKDIRRKDIIRNVPMAIEMFFIPNPAEILASQFQNSSSARRSYFQASNPNLIQRAVYKLDSGLWSLLFRRRDLASRQ